MRRADRLFQIVQYLRGGRLLTARTLAERLEVSERTIYRDMADLIGTGVPIEGESGVGYLMRSGYDLPPLMFNREEMVALVAGARMIRAWGGAAMAQAAEEALVKINEVLPEVERARAKSIEIHAFSTSQMTDEVRRRIDDLERAVDSRTRLILSYRDKADQKTERPVRPLGLWFWGKVWTLVGWCELRNDFRIFRLDRIDAMVADGAFKAEHDKALRLFYAREAEKGRERR
ncbi:MAG: YafY family transcriptional regulator [Alphaproteobacteria bacterium]|nr:YafY family transcriptional regulator [Alphaproteobacteria bacterium]